MVADRYIVDVCLELLALLWWDETHIFRRVDQALYRHSHLPGPLLFKAIDSSIEQLRDLIPAKHDVHGVCTLCSAWALRNSPRLQWQMQFSPAVLHDVVALSQAFSV